MAQSSHPDRGPLYRSPAELRRMPRDERRAILEQMAILAEPLYRNDPELTAFEAFGPDDLYGESSSSENGRTEMASGPQLVPEAEPKIRRISARDLMAMPRPERRVILRKMAKIAEPLYRNDPELTAFEAFGPDDLYGESSSSETL